MGKNKKIKKKETPVGFSFLDEEELEAELIESEKEAELYGESGERKGGGGGSSNKEAIRPKERYTPVGSQGGFMASVERDKGRSKLSREEIEKKVKRK